MKHLLSLLIFVLTVQSAFALSLDDRRKKIIRIIDEELSEVERLARQTGNRNPDHLLRMAELNFEKGRLWKDKENEVYLTMPAKERRKVRKKDFFSKSNRYFNNAISLCRTIVKRFPRYRHIGDVYYILGFDAKEKNKVKTAASYLNKAIKRSKGGTETKVKSQIALAENYYNRKMYRKAIPLYESALRTHRDRWYTKDSFNLAWCYYRARQYTKSINKMKDVHRNSGKGKYVDMKAQVERDIGYVYATSGRIDEGIRFYEKLGVDFSGQLIRIAIQLKKEGSATNASKVLRYAEKYIKDKEKLADVYIEQMVLYEQFNNSASHMKAARNLFNMYKKKRLNSNQVKTLIYQVGKMGAVLQKRVASKSYQKRPKTRRVTAKRATEYFGMMVTLVPKKASEYLFLQGETSFANRDYTSALKYYNSAFDRAERDRNNKFKDRAMDGMLATLGKPSVPKKVKENYYVPTYEKYLKMKPKGKVSYSIYQKLFNVYKERKQYDKAEGVLNRFQKAYPKDYGKQEAMIAHLMDVSRKKKDHAKIRDWVEKIDAGKYKVSGKYKKKLQELLTTIQIEEVQNSLNKGDKKKALVGYHKILKDPHSTKRSKINAKYNLAALYYELGAADQAHDWSLKAIDEMGAKDVKNFSDSFLAIANYLFGNMYFYKSANISSKILMKVCKYRTKRKSIAFKNSAYIYLANNNLDNVEKLIEYGKKCKVPSRYVSEVQLELLKEYANQKRWKKYETLAEDMSFRKANWAKLIVPYQRIIDVNKNYGNTTRVRQLTQKRSDFYRYAKKRKRAIPVEALDLIANEEMVGLNSLFSQLTRIQLTFPEKKFNPLVMKKLALLDKITAKVGGIQKIGSGDGIIKAYNVLVKSYEHISSSLKNFSPPGKSPGFVKSFKKAMAETYIPLERKARSFRKEALQVMAKNDVLSEGNFELVQGSGMAVRYWSPYHGVTMDRGGKR
jgi:tetratricopeptide (TPR) repeat protein